MDLSWSARYTGCLKSRIRVEPSVWLEGLHHSYSIMVEIYYLSWLVGPGSLRWLVRILLIVPPAILDLL